jgi:hypothetical protein
MLIAMLTAILFNFFTSSVITGALHSAGFTNVSVMVVFGVVMLLAVRFGENKKPMVGILQAGAFQDVWVSWLLENFYSNFPFLDKMRDLSSFVKNDIINVREIGADPNVLINNNSYPIAISERTDGNYAISLNKYETENTAVNLKESQRLDYDKVMSVIGQHEKALMQKTQEQWTHALGISGNTSNTPVLRCSGADRGNGTRKMTAADLIRFQQACDLLKIPVSGRMLLLSSNHSADLVSEDLTRFKTLSDLKSGEVVDMFGFQIARSIHTPKYHKTAQTKLAFGAAPTANDTDASIMWHEGEAGYAKGSMTLHYKPAAINTEFRRDEMGVSMFGITTLLRNKNCAAIISADTGVAV